MDVLSLVGLAAVTAMLIFYALEDRISWYSLAFAGVCALGSLMASRRAHGLSTVEAIWATARPRRLAILSVPGISVLGMKYGCHCPG
jgi:hypothetical protein